MDPVSATASVVSIIDFALRTTTALFTYLQDTKNAASNKNLLAEEASSLLQVLKSLHDRAGNKNRNAIWNHQQQDLAHKIGRACEDVAELLKFDVKTGKIRQEGRLKSIHSSAIWSFSKSEVYSILERIARLQQYANTLLLGDQR